MALLSNLSASDKELLRLSPFWTFHLVANNNPKIKIKDLAKFKIFLADFTTQLLKDPEFTYQRAELEISVSVLESVNANFAYLEKAVLNYPKDYISNLVMVGDLVDAYFNRHEAQLFKQVLVNLALKLMEKQGVLKLLQKNIENNPLIEELKKAIKYRGYFTITSK